MDKLNALIAVCCSGTNAGDVGEVNSESFRPLSLRQFQKPKTTSLKTGRSLRYCDKPETYRSVLPQVSKNKGNYVHRKKPLAVSATEIRNKTLKKSTLV